MCCIVLFQNKTGENFFMISVTDKFRKSILILFQCDSVYLVNYDLEKFFHGSVDECYKPQLGVIPASGYFAVERKLEAKLSERWRQFGVSYSIQP